MSANDTKVASNILTALAQANDSQRDYLMGFAEGVIQSNKKQDEKKSKRKKRKQ